MNNQPIQELPLVVVAAGIICQKGKILLTRRRHDVYQGGLWEFPGGKQEEGESIENCLRRELKEEIDIEVTHLKPLCTLHYRYPEQVVELHFFTCAILAGIPKILECLELAWVPKHQLPLYEFPPADFPVIEKIMKIDF